MTSIGRYFQLGGFGMIPTTIAGFVAIGIGIWAVMRPTPIKSKTLSSLVVLVMILGVCGMASGMTAVGLSLDNPSFFKARGITGDSLPTIGFVGAGEAMVNLWWAGAFGSFATLLRIWSDVRLARA